MEHTQFQIRLNETHIHVSYVTVSINYMVHGITVNQTKVVIDVVN